MSQFTEVELLLESNGPLKYTNKEIKDFYKVHPPETRMPEKYIPYTDEELDEWFITHTASEPPPIKPHFKTGQSWIDLSRAQYFIKERFTGYNEYGVLLKAPIVIASILDKTLIIHIDHKEFDELMAKHNADV